MHSMLKFSEVILNPYNFYPFIEISFDTKLVLKKGMFAHGETVINVLVSEYRDALESQLKDELEKYKYKLGE